MRPVILLSALVLVFCSIVGGCTDRLYAPLAHALTLTPYQK